LDLSEYPAEEEMMFQALRQDCIHSVGNLRDQLRLSRSRFRAAQRVPYLDHSFVDAPHQVDEQAQHSGDSDIDDEASCDRLPPRGSLVGTHR